MLGFNRWHVLRLVAVVSCVAGTAWLALVYLIPAPPAKITVATSLQGDHYQVLGTRYQGILSGSSVELELRPTEGAKENLRLLNDPSQPFAAPDDGLDGLPGQVAVPAEGDHERAAVVAVWLGW